MCDPDPRSQRHDPEEDREHTEAHSASCVTANTVFLWLRPIDRVFLDWLVGWNVHAGAVPCVVEVLALQKIERLVGGRAGPGFPQVYVRRVRPVHGNVGL